MARRRRSQGKPIELFPFLAILACVIGVLTLVIAGLSLGALQIDTSGTDFARLARATAADEAKVADLERQMEGSRILATRIRHARAELWRREEVSKEAAKLQLEKAKLQKQLDKATKKQEELRASLRTMQRETVELENQLKGRRTELDPQRQILVKGPRARDGQKKYKPWFVECRKLEVVLNADLAPSRQTIVPFLQIQQSPEFIRIYTSVRRAERGFRPKKEIIILIVREGGVTTRDYVAALLGERNVRSGSIPVPGAQPIDFSQLKEAK